MELLKTLLIGLSLSHIIIWGAAIFSALLVSFVSMNNVLAELSQDGQMLRILEVVAILCGVWLAVEVYYEL